MVQGGVLLMDTPADYGLTVLLLLTTATPRLLWLYLWAREEMALTSWYGISLLSDLSEVLHVGVHDRN
jgi:hypothetical protein